MKRTEEKISCFIKEHNLIESGDKILVAFSGGPDSVFALHFLKKFRKKYSIKISAVHFNHQLRGKESDEDVHFAQEFCKKENIDFFMEKLDVKKLSRQKKISIEEAARELRYKKIDELIKEHGFSKIVTAHNLSDNSETVLLNLLTGTSIAGLSGIPIKREKIIRPLLCVTKSEIENYLFQAGIQYRVDSSNNSNEFKRNYLRNKILPSLREEINPSLDEAIFRTTKNFEKSLFINKKILDHFFTNFVLRKSDSCELNLKIIDVFGEIPGEILKRIFVDEFSLEFNHQLYTKINLLVKKQKGKKLQLANNIIVYREANNLKFCKESFNEIESVIIKVGETKFFGDVEIGIEETKLCKDIYKKKGYELISGDNLDDYFTLRKWQNGDVFVPLGFNGIKKISDFLTDSKIPAYQKKNKLVLLNRNKIVWVVGLRISDHVKIMNNTKKVLKLWMN